MTTTDDKEVFAKTGWQAGDILSLRPGWSEEDAEAWLFDNQRYIVDAMVEAGWNAIDTLLPPKDIR